ncbi:MULTISPECIES: hypothetical protein [Salipiger]|jgi:hypothetical protein|uniref:Uncharacterized protein n=1 Tax=Salipiger profundus TaxID=1229727 RepID=A0A1U7DAB4_9RHOB|nr:MULTISPECIES: hypothetical protein [Salipiger]APX24995.1 hypothetical protein Ga0080559_TMP4199 [Salipiger profundus]SFD13277.1 hypothetical protein SAMN05444415_107295 [Salipiger profundus]
METRTTSKIIADAQLDRAQMIRAFFAKIFSFGSHGHPVHH